MGNYAFTAEAHFSGEHIFAAAQDQYATPTLFYWYYKTNS